MPIISSDPASADAAASNKLLPSLVRYRDLEEAGICKSWWQLGQLIDRHGFPAGIWLSTNTRAWAVDEVRAWLANRPHQRKVPPPLKPGSRRRGRVSRRSAEAG